MDNFKAIYKILRSLEAAMDCPEFDMSQISHETPGVSVERWSRYIETMADVGLIKGAKLYGNILGVTHVDNERTPHNAQRA